MQREHLKAPEDVCSEWGQGSHEVTVLLHRIKNPRVCTDVNSWKRSVSRGGKLVLQAECRPRSTDGMTDSVPKSACDKHPMLAQARVIREHHTGG